VRALSLASVCARYNLLSLDLMDGRNSSSAERIILEGDPAYKLYKGIIKLR